MTLPPAAPRRQLEHRRQIDVQAFAGEAIDTRGHADGASRPVQIDRCHALKSDGEVAQQFYPRRHRPAAVVPPTD